MIATDNKKSIRIMGIDPGTAIVGWGIITEDKKNPIMEAYGCIETSKHKSDVDRLKEVADDIRELIIKYKPDEVAIEELFFFKNLKTAIKVAQARGVLLLIVKEARVGIFEYTPLQVKQAITGYGRAEKKQIQVMVKSILGLKDIPKPDDAADALAIALCHQQSRTLLACG
jgi:crossover junction endodeoxyribonuclease RuvC